MGERRRARELALQLLFQIEITRDPAEEAAARFWNSQNVPPETRQFADALTFGALQHRDDIDAEIASSADHWRLERMAVVDRNVMRMAIFELRHLSTPPAVVIDEAIEVARKYGTEESASFINGVLDAVRRRVEPSRSGTS